VIIPTFQNQQYVDEEGYLTSQMQMYNDELNNTLRNGLSDNGWTLPTVTQQQLTDIIAITGPDALPNGTIWYVADPAINPTYNEIVVLLDDGTSSGTSALYKLTKAAYP
jgi:hypothetical protein